MIKMDTVNVSLACVLLLTLVSVSLSCPDDCTCVKDITSCMDKNLTDIPEGIPTNTQRLFLKGLQIKILQPKSFETLTSLKELSATNCQIEEIKAHAFSGLSSLTSLDLKHNNIKQLDAFTFSGMSALKTLRLDSNRLEIINNFAFHGLNLSRLSLEQNENLREMFPKAFDETRVHNLRIFNSTLSSQSAKALIPLKTSLQELSWEFNRRPLSFPEDLFMGFNMQRLTLIENAIRDTSFLKHVVVDDLSLVGNPTGSIDFSQYPNLKQVRTLALDDTGFSQPDGKYFAEMTHLSQLLLASNGITTLPENLREVFERVDILQLQHNDFHCNCELWWFKEWADVNADKVQGARCKSPVEGDMIMIKNKEEFLCTAPKSVKITKDIVTSGSISQLTLTCESSSNPAPTIIWLQPGGVESSRSPPSANRSVTTNIGILPFSNNNEDDNSDKAANYKCIAINLAGNASAEVTVDLYKVMNEASHSNHTVGSSTGTLLPSILGLVSTLILLLMCGRC